jgi:hypothetical protein
MKKIILFFALLSIANVSSFAQMYQEQIRDRYKEHYEEMHSLYLETFASYSEVLSHYPEALTDHFLQPENKIVLHLHLGYPGTSYLNSVYEMLLLENEQIKEIKEDVESKSLKQYHFTDSCLMITDYNPELYDSTLYRLKQCDCFSEMLPMPNFQFCIESPLPLEFYENATIYVLGAEKGFFLEENYLSNDGVGLPEKWLHGYTKGVVVSGNIALYWLEVW